MTSTRPLDAPSLESEEPDPLFRTVVLGIDFAPSSLGAARWATSYVAPGAEAILAHVAPPPAPETDARTEELPSRAGGLDGFAATLGTAGVRTVIRAGKPSRWLSAIANETGASLVVLGRRKDAGRKRVGEPNVLERVVRSTSALTLPAGTTTLRTPSTVVRPVTPYTDQSRPLVAASHELPADGYAGSTGLKPNVIRSNGVWKWRRFAAGSVFGPSGGSFASDAAFDVPQMFVKPSARSVNPYAAAALIGPETLCTPTRADPFTTSSTSYFWTTGFVK